MTDEHELNPPPADASRPSSGVDDAAVVELQLLEASYRAALEANARVIQPSLDDFLR